MAARFAEINNLLARRQYREADSLLGGLEQCQALTPNERFNVGWLYGRGLRFESALKIFRSLSPDVPNPQMHRYAIALTEFELGNYRQTVEALKDTQSSGALDFESANLLGVAYSKLGLYQDAYAVMRQNLEQNPGELFAYLNLITLFADSGHLNEGLEVSERAVKAFPQKSDALIARGVSKTLLGRLDDAHSDFAAAIQIDPANASSRFLLALTDYQSDKLVVAIAELKAAIQSGIIDPDLHYLLAECIRKSDPDATAAILSELDAAIRINRLSVASRTMRGTLLLKQGHTMEAIQDLELAHKIDPGSRSAAYNLARADMKLGKDAEAKALLQQLPPEEGNELSEVSQRRLREALAGNASLIK